MPYELPEQLIRDAEAAVDYAQSVRKLHRRRTDRGSKRRQTDIDVAQQRIKEAMKPLRSVIGRFPYGPKTEEAEENRQIIREVSDRLQAERRKLWKMAKHG